MQNLEDVKQRFLINTLTVKDFAYYSNNPDSEGAVSRLMIKKHGKEIPWVAGSTTVRNETTKAGALKSVLLLVNGPAPCDMCHYEYGLEVHRKWQQPGDMNDDLYPKSKTFGGVIEALQTTSGGQIADSDKLTIESTIMAGIEGDQLGFSSTREPNIVHCKRLYIMTTAADNTHQIVYTIAGVTSAAVLLNSGSTVLTQVNDINVEATMSLSLVAFAIDATHFAVTSVNPGLDFTIDDGGGATTLSGITRYLWIYAKYDYVKFYLTFKPFGWATVTPFNLTILDNTSAAAGNSVFYLDIANVATASGNIANSATSITYAANIRGSSLTGYIYATSKLTAGSVYVYVYTGARELIIRSLGTAGVTVNTAYSGAGRWPSLTGWDVFREFMNAGGFDKQSNMVFLGQPDPDSTVKWNKLTLTYTQAVPALEGANHRDNHKQEVSIYIKQGYGSTSLWDATNYLWESASDGAFTADSSINDLLAIWSGLTAGTVNDATHWLTVV